VQGNFDDCQTAVKAAFNDPDFNAELLQEHRLELSSANSINWGRLLQQIVYYVSAYVDLAVRGGIAWGDELDVCVPTGNFGNILAAFYAKRMGLPLGRLLCASNENNVLSDFLSCGCYQVSGRAFVTTPSPSMDILISSNLERALFEICRDPDQVRSWMRSLSETGAFTVDATTFARLQGHFLGDHVSNEESLEVIRRVWQEHSYLLDPHTAVAWRVAERWAADRPLLVVATAHWAKFAADVYRALHGLPYAESLPADSAGLSGFELLDRVLQAAPGQQVPVPLRELKTLPERFTSTVKGSPAGVEGAVRAWLAGH
jgi:threonine synthase